MVALMGLGKADLPSSCTGRCLRQTCPSCCVLVCAGIGSEFSRQSAAGQGRTPDGHQLEKCSAGRARGRGGRSVLFF